MADSQFKKKLFAAPGGKSQNKILLLSLKPEEYDKKSFAAACGLAGVPGIYVTMGKLWRDINDQMQKQGIDTSNFYWIGGTGVGFWSKDSTLKGKVAENVTLLEGPTALMHLHMAIDMLVATRKYQYLFFDSVNVMADNNKQAAVENFFVLLAKKMKAAGIAVVYVYVDQGEAQKVLPVLSALADSTLKAKDVK